ncbi:YceI family protein [Flammeovirgaceae bacterium SG7u.111]|nr:YceI family protein [Flammeovirgaceae bacterium SG7u.132]WPO38594.1 YceI family protein [Flammeovirgaceae bacterium SG7u.111]
MQKYILILFLTVSSQLASAQGKFKLAGSEVNFFSSAPLEHISAINKNAIGVIDFDKKEFLIRVPIKGFVFSKSLMQEHFNENYMESDTYPSGILKGSFTGDVNLKKDGEYELEAVGDLELHGKVDKRTIPVTLIVKKGKASIRSAFNVKLVDHDIEIPQVVSRNIAEEIVVKINSDLVGI